MSDDRGGIEATNSGGGEEERRREGLILSTLHPFRLYTRIFRNIPILNSTPRSFSMFELRKHAPPLRNHFFHPALSATNFEFATIG